MKIIKYIISFILILCIIASITIGIIANTIASKEYTLKKLEEIGFYDKVEEEIKDTFQNFILQSGMDNTVLENIFEKEKLKQDINNLVDAIYENKEINIDTKDIKTKLTQNINDYLQKNKLRITNQSEVDNFTNTIEESYSNGIVYSISVVKQATPITAKAINIIQKVQPIIYIVTAVVAIVLILSNLKIKSEIAKYIGISMLSAGIVLSAIKTYITTRININSISVLNESLTELVHNIANQVLNYIFYSGIIVAVIGLILVIIKIMSIKEEE